MGFLCFRLLLLQNSSAQRTRNTRFFSAVISYLSRFFTI
uniref:Uncharacterized protein n=1 Tax=Arundo donax TaxID=35708 RepID=A0A0A8YBP4_ARUDO